MKELFPYIRIFKSNLLGLLLGLTLSATGLLASIGLLGLSGWFLAASFLSGSIFLLNFFYPSSGVRGLAILRVLARYFDRIVSHNTTFKILANLRINLFKKLLPLSPAKIQNFKNSELLNILVSDVDTLDTLYLNLVNPFVNALLLITFIGIGMYFISIPIMLAMCLGLLIFVVTVPFIFYKLGKNTGSEIIQSRAEFRSQLVEWLELNAELTIFNKLQLFRKKTTKTANTWYNLLKKENHLTGFSNALLFSYHGILFCTVIYLLSISFHLNHNANHDALVALVIFTALASFEILMPIGATFLNLGQIMRSATRLNQITNQEPQVQFNQKQQWQTPSNKIIEFKNIDFTYPKLKQNILENCNFTVKKDEKVAIIGKTGNGKSTIFQLLVRNYDPIAGQILLNNQPIQNYSEFTLRQNITTLSQRVHIFNQTLKENLLIGNPNASDEDLKNILKLVQLDHLLENQDLDLWLGEGGRALSGGEGRRIGLARLLLSNADIWLLDEPTEGLDQKTEKIMLEQILNHQNKTIVMITHRKQGLDKFDKIYSLENCKMSQI